MKYAQYAVAVVAVVALAACGGTSTADEAASAAVPTALDGAWIGTTTVTTAGVAAKSSSVIHIIIPAAGHVTVGDLCGVGSSLAAIPTGADTFSIKGFACTAPSRGACEPSVVVVTGGTGSLSAGGTLTISASGVTLGCGDPPVTYLFVGHR